MTLPESLQEQAIDRFWETVPPVWNFVRSHIRATAIGNFDITVEQFHILRYVRRGTGSMSELAAAKNISRPAMSQAVDVLVKKKLLNLPSINKHFLSLIQRQRNGLLKVVSLKF